MRHVHLLLLMFMATSASAQDVVTGNQLLGSNRPETWAMDYLGATTVMTSFGATPTINPWRWNGAIDLGEIPRLSNDQQRVGFNGFKQEDLNKSPIFGRARLSVGLPGGWIAELGWTPPVAINGLRTRDLFAVALGRVLYATAAFRLSARGFGQHGSAQGDITCPARLAGVTDPVTNPAGCAAPSRDRIALQHYGVDATAAWEQAPWHWHASAGAVRMEPEVQVDALVGTVRDRTRLVARTTRPFFALGVGRDLTPHWRLSAEVLYVPLDVERDPGSGSQRDPLTSLRLQLRYANR